MNSPDMMAAEPLADGIQFPQDAGGRRSSTAFGKEVLTAALALLDRDAALAVEDEIAWRRAYPRYFVDMVRAAVKRPDQTAPAAAAALDCSHRLLEFRRDGQESSLAEALKNPGMTRLYTACVAGVGGPPTQGLSIPYGGAILAGDDLRRRIDDWEGRGIIEPSHGEALLRVIAHPEWLDLSGERFVLLGAGAEMGPFHLLGAWGAEIIAVDLNRPQIWQRLITSARGFRGTLTFPVRRSSPKEMTDEELARAAGADLLIETPELFAWLRDLEGPLTVGCYAYLDGEKHVRVVMAMDAIMQALIRTRTDIRLAFLHTPTNVFALPAAVAAVAVDGYAARGGARLWQDPLSALSGRRFFQPNVREMVPGPEGNEYGVIDSLVVQQGPNYALAKWLQQWRALTAREEGFRVSANVAPSTATESVLKNGAMAAAYAGAGHFGMEVFQPETSNALMAALLVHDLRAEQSVANPALPLDHPLDLFVQGANHGGLWRAPFQSRSVMEIAAALGWFRRG